MNRVIAASFVLGAMCLGALTQADVIDFGTSPGNAANWKITGAGASGASAFSFDSTLISITSTNHGDGTYVTGASGANFNGFWFADFTFALPSNATGTTLSFSGLTADDRAVLELNGNIIGNFYLNQPSGGAGKMSFPPGPPDQDFTFTNVTSGTITSGFLPGQNNVLRLIINNTDTSNLNASTVTFQNSGDGTEAGIVGTVSFSVPEPSAALLLLIGLGVLVSTRNRCGQSTASI